jgi:uncharacterized membrane protein YcaP (DUF421 family)
MIDLPLLWAAEAPSPMFHLGLSVFEKAFRPIVVYVFLVILLRIFGKRELAQLNPFDLIVLLSLSNTLQNAMIGDDNSITGGLIGAFSLCAINYMVVRFLFKHHRLDQWIEGKPAVFIKDGKLRPKALARELLSRSELLTIAHRQGFASLDEIESCVLETGGTFYIEPKQPRQSARHQAAILDRLDDLARQIEDLKQHLRPREPEDH